MLEGVSRRTVIEMAHSLSIEVQVRTLPADELRAATEVFISTSGGGVLPVTVVDKQVVGDGKPGPMTGKLIQTYWDWHTLPAYSLPIDYSL
jgi:branched-chain amino acid aminotransferase